MFVDRRQGYLSGLDSAGFDLSTTRICVRLHAVLLWLTNSALFNDFTFIELPMTFYKVLLFSKI